MSHWRGKMRHPDEIHKSRIADDNGQPSEEVMILDPRRASISFRLVFSSKHDVEQGHKSAKVGKRSENEPEKGNQRDHSTARELGLVLDLEHRVSSIEAGAQGSKFQQSKEHGIRHFGLRGEERIYRNRKCLQGESGNTFSQGGFTYEGDEFTLTFSSLNLCELRYI